MHVTGRALVPGVAHGALWAPPAASQTGPGNFDDFRRARERLLAQTVGMAADFADMFTALALDPMWDDAVGTRLGRAEPLATAIAGAAAELAALLDRVEDPYLRERRHDLEQIGAHLVRLLDEVPAAPPAAAIVCAPDISAIELVRWAPQLAGVVLFDVGATAHIAIVARGLALPALLVSGAPELRTAAAPNDRPARTAVLNASEGWLETMADAALVSAHPPRRISVQPDPRPVKLESRTIGVYANINAIDDAVLAATLGADGIGLLRTEFLYTGESAPSLDEERRLYGAVADAFRGRTIIVRTLDLGGDKLGADFACDGLDHGMLGIRGIRLTLRQPELFARHLQAILEGFSGVDLRIMFPMIAVRAEFDRARAAVQAAASAAGRTCPPLGFMLEIPAAAYAAQEFAQAGATFMSVGTNDLTQYFFAASRLTLDDAIDPAQSVAFQTFVREAIGRAKSVGLEVGVCGEAAASPELSRFWIDCGVDELSVAPALVPWLKAHLRATSFSIAELAAKE